MSNTQRDASKGALLVLFLVTMIDLIGFGIVIPFLTYLVEDLADSQGIVEVGIWVGILMTSYSAAQFLFSPIWGSISDRIGRRPVLMIGLVGNTVFFTMFGLANTLLIALVARFLAGVFNGNIAVARAYIGDVSTLIDTFLKKNKGLGDIEHIKFRAERTVLDNHELESIFETGDRFSHPTNDYYREYYYKELLDDLETLLKEEN